MATTDALLETPQDPKTKILPHYSVVNIPQGTATLPISFFGDTVKTVKEGRTSLTMPHRLNKGEDFVIQGIGKIYPQGIIKADFDLLMAKNPFIVIRVGSEEKLKTPLFMVKNIQIAEGATGENIKELPGSYTELPNRILIPDETNFDVDLYADNGTFTGLASSGGLNIGIVLFGYGKRRS